MSDCKNIFKPEDEPTASQFSKGTILCSTCNSSTVLQSVATQHAKLKTFQHSESQGLKVIHSTCCYGNGHWSMFPYTNVLKSKRIEGGFIKKKFLSDSSEEIFLELSMSIGHFMQT